MESGIQPEFCAVANSPSRTVDCGSCCFMNPKMSAMSDAAVSCSAFAITFWMFGFASLKSLAVCHALNLSIRSITASLEAFVMSALSFALSHPDFNHPTASSITAFRFSGVSYPILFNAFASDLITCS